MSYANNQYTIIKVYICIYGGLTDYLLHNTLNIEEISKADECPLSPGIDI